MPRRATGETPFAMAYGMEAVIPLEAEMPTLKTTAIDAGLNEPMIGKDLDLLEERREAALIRLAIYQQQMSKGYNRKVRPHPFSIGELVLKKVLPGERKAANGKLGATWDGPYEIVSIAGVGAYRIRDGNGRELKHPWNATHLDRKSVV